MMTPQASRIFECENIRCLNNICKSVTSAKYFQSSFLAKRDSNTGGIRTAPIGGKMLPRKRSSCKKRGWASQVRLLERFVDGVLLALLQPVQSHRRVGARR